METAKEDCIANLVDAIHDLRNVRSEIIEASRCFDRMAQETDNPDYYMHSGKFYTIIRIMNEIDYEIKAMREWMADE